jgi:tetratricopeptide (TPR) repeat protein
MKMLLINAVFLILALHVEPARVMALVKGSVCPSYSLLPDSSTDRNYRVSAIRRMILEDKEDKQDKAMQLAEGLIRAEGTNYEGYFWKGYIQHQRREFYSAIKTLRTAERLNPQGNAIAKLLSICYGLLGQRQLFVRKMQEAATLDPRDFAPHYYLGRNAAGSFKCEDAKSYFQAALQRNPADYLSNYELGYCFESSGLLQQARRHYDLSIMQAEQCHTEFGLPFAGLSRTALLENDLGQALTHGRRAVQLAPNSAANRMLLGQVLIKAALQAEAIDQLKKAVALDPTASTPYYLLYQSYLKTGAKRLAEVTLSEFKRVLAYYGEGLP